MQTGARTVLVGCAVVAMAVSATEAAGQCQRADFEAVVDEAAGALRDLNAANKPKFQEKLRRLKETRGWTQEQFLKEAAPLVADATIAAYDRQSSELLSKIASGGEEGAAAASPDCAMLDTLRASMRTLVEAQTSKWAHMNGKLDGELAK